MRFHITSALLLVATALAATPSDISLMTVGGQAGQFEYLTDIETLKRTPDWTPGKQEPPLSFSEACHIAVEAGKRRFPKAENISIQSVTLTQYHSGPADIVRWHYEVEILPVVGGKIHYADLGNPIVILMDGSVIEPTWREHSEGHPEYRGEFHPEVDLAARQLNRQYPGPVLGSYGPFLPCLVGCWLGDRKFDLYHPDGTWGFKCNEEAPETVAGRWRVEGDKFIITNEEGLVLGADTIISCTDHTLVLEIKGHKKEYKVFSGLPEKRSNQPMKPAAPSRNEFGVFATTPCRGLSVSR